MPHDREAYYAAQGDFEREGPPTDSDALVAPVDGPAFLHEWDADLLATTPPARRALLSRPDGSTWLPASVSAMLIAAGGVGKSTLAAQLALSVATGRPFLDSLRVNEPGSVLLAFCEADREEMHRTLYYGARQLNLSRDEQRLAQARICAYPLAGKPAALLENDANGNLRTAGAYDTVRDTLRRRATDWRLVVWDTIARGAPLEAEKDNAIATRVISALESWIDAPGRPTVLGLHHTSKAARAPGQRASADASRGSSAFTDSPRWVAMLSEVPDVNDGVELRIVKANNVRRGDAIRLVRGNGGVMRPMPLATEAQIRESAA